MAETLADLAGAAIRPYFRSVQTVERKADESPVTLADKAAEAVMRAELARACPGHGIVGEEFGATGAGARFCWVLDPIDGTRAFITGRPTFGTLIALLDDGIPVLGVIDQPITGERWVGMAGRPTRFSGPLGGAVGCRPCPALAQAELSSTSPDMFGPGLERWQRLGGQVRRTTFGGDCYAYGLLALGQIDIVAEATMQVWDWAALVPVITGAGGMMTDWAGQALHADGDGSVLAVGDPALLAQAVGILSG